MRYHREWERSQQSLGVSDLQGVEHLDHMFCPNLNELLFHYLTAYSLPHLLKCEDRNSMAHSIEARVPFTDYRLVEYVFTLPSIYEIRQGWTKWLLRLAVADLLPPQIVWRKDKLGFATPAWGSRQQEWDAWRGVVSQRWLASA